MSFQCTLVQNFVAAGQTVAVPVQKGLVFFEVRAQGGAVVFDLERLSPLDTTWTKVDNGSGTKITKTLADGDNYLIVVEEKMSATPDFQPQWRVNLTTVAAASLVAIYQ